MLSSTATPFPVTMDYSQWYWDPSTFTWLPSTPPTSPYYSDPVYSYDTCTPTTTYSYPTEATGYTLDPYSHMNQASYDSYLNYDSPNYIPGCAPANTPTYSQPMLSPQTYSQPMMSPAPAPSTAPVAAPPVTPAPVAPPTPSTPNATAPRKCGNCGTTESCKWRNVRSKDNIRCNTCYDYRRRTKKERSADVIQNYEWLKMVKSQ